ncbi:unnamed protein product [Ilex paraguariensis]|uniref:Methyltransferase type 11 domain-containing protein n=1 Tax=Ilex paraguariensis TaxID=185542 RepID=A0ABC8SC69_9AQUA
MESIAVKPSVLRNILVRFFFFCVLIVGIRFAYIVTIRGESCDVGDFCFFSLPENLNMVTVIGQLSTSSSAIIVNDAVPPKPKTPDLWATKGFQNAVRFYSSIFQDLISEGYLSPNSKSLCVETQTGPEVFALKEIGVSDSIGIFKKASKPLVISGQATKQPFKHNTFDFVFSGAGMLDKSSKPAEFAAEICRTLKPEGFLVVHTAAKDTYSFNSFIDLFNCCTLMRSRDIDGFDSSMPYIREIVMNKGGEIGILGHGTKNPGGDSVNECSVSGHKQELIRKAEPVIIEEPSKPWITLKKNLKNIKYLSSMVDISFKQRYVYFDVGARSYGSSIVSWFKKQYPKQNKTFEIYAIEADKTFHEEYKYKKGVTLLPYAAWVRNETLFFEINQDPGHKEVEKGRGMGRIQPAQLESSSVGDVDKIKGFDFANWLKSVISPRDFVVMKMDVEGTEFDLIPRLFETGAICLIDEIFLECHYNRWQKCCPGERTSKYQKTYGQCVELFTSLRASGVLVHQWW